MIPGHAVDAGAAGIFEVFDAFAGVPCGIEPQVDRRRCNAPVVEHFAPLNQLRRG